MSYHRCILEPYHAGRRYSRCPGCGKDSYTLYVYAETGEYINETVGMCRRRNSCGYHLPPREYFTRLNDKKWKLRLRMQQQ
ncbi:PG0870-related protein [Alistipes sp.]|uniref:PG0870-related protein n=1 Tax=Alistipes sp. TaxID=1872444 RepID=UPI003AB13357